MLFRCAMMILTRFSSIKQRAILIAGQLIGFIPILNLVGALDRLSCNPTSMFSAAPAESV